MHAFFPVIGQPERAARSDGFADGQSQAGGAFLAVYAVGKSLEQERCVQRR